MHLPLVGTFGKSPVFIPRASNKGRTIEQLVGIVAVGPPCTSVGAVDDNAAAFCATANTIECNVINNINPNNLCVHKNVHNGRLFIENIIAKFFDCRMTMNRVTE